MKEDKLAKTVFFIASPFLTLPTILCGIYKKSQFSILLMVFIFGFLSYLYIPTVSNDRARYFEMFVEFQRFDFKDFITYLGAHNRPDFILHFLVYLTASLGLPLQLLLFGVTSFTVGTCFYLFNKVTENLNLTNKSFFLCFLIVLFSFSLDHLLSGTRFYFGAAWVLLAFYNGLFKGNHLRAILLLIVALFTHFSSALFIPLYFILYYFPRNYNFYKFFFLTSFIAFLLPKDIIVSVLSLLDFSGGYAAKAELYLEKQDFVQRGIAEGSSNYILVYFFSIAWSIFAYLYLIYTIRRKSLFRNLLLLSFAAVNLFYPVTNVYSRYLIVVKIIFVLLLIYEYREKRSLKPIFITLGLLTLNIVSNFIVLRNNIEASYLTKYSLSSFLIFFREITPQDFLIF
ncbi:EpsG family protein [Salegentibacter mishustinae]|uniref:EpsG family protein n=1 Tax=Salegentibacter mishustinae TaxID=270918 RepID=UPI0024910AB6|nr:EpsG family protein [Salegentibacter mishustinae]